MSMLTFLKVHHMFRILPSCVGNIFFCTFVRRTFLCKRKLLYIYNTTAHFQYRQHSIYTDLLQTQETFLLIDHSLVEVNGVSFTCRLPHFPTQTIATIESLHITGNIPTNGPS